MGQQAAKSRSEPRPGLTAGSWFRPPDTIPGGHPFTMPWRRAPVHDGLSGFHRRELEGARVLPGRSEPFLAGLALRPSAAFRVAVGRRRLDLDLDFRKSAAQPG